MPPKSASAVPQLRETGRLRSVMAGQWPVRFWWTKHARAEMMKDHIRLPDIDRLCRHGAVVWIEWKHDELWHVEGTDLDGRSIRAVIAPMEGDAETVIKVVTAMAL